MRNSLRYVFVASCAISLVGCSSKFNFIQQRQTEYLRTQAAAPLQVPAGMSSTNLHEDYAIPGGANATSSTPPSLLPPNSMAEQIKTGKLSENILKQTPKYQSVTPEANSIIDQSADEFKNNNLILSQPADEVWLPLGDAIEQAGYTIVHKNQKTMTYYVLDTYATNGKLTRETPIYQVHARNIPLGTEVYITENSGKAAKLNDANRILDSLRKGLAKKVKVANNPARGMDAKPVATQSQIPTSNFGQLMHTIFHFNND